MLIVSLLEHLYLTREYLLIFELINVVSRYHWGKFNCLCNLVHFVVCRNDVVAIRDEVDARLAYAVSCE